MILVFFSLYCLVKNTLPPKVFFKFFKEQDLVFISKNLLDFAEKNPQNAIIYVGSGMCLDQYCWLLLYLL